MISSGKIRGTGRVRKDSACFYSKPLFVVLKCFCEDNICKDLETKYDQIL